MVMLDSALHIHTAPRGSADGPVGDGSGRERVVVVGYDGSEPAKRALERAAALAGDRADILVMAVAEPSPRSGVTIPANRDAVEARRRRHDLEEARALLSGRGLSVKTVLVWGNPARALVEAGREADLTIVGSRGLNRLQRLILGSVSSKVARNAASDVLVVR
jgi:nucleotide-binding universal stress UspA family protein